jgi:hypothetical protein
VIVAEVAGRNRRVRFFARVVIRITISIVVMMVPVVSVVMPVMVMVMVGWFFVGSRPDRIAEKLGQPVKMHMRASAMIRRLLRMRMRRPRSPRCQVANDEHSSDETAEHRAFFSLAE